MSAARSIRLFLVDGTATGILTAEIVNWTGHFLHAPRGRLAEVLERPEATRTGVYFLFSEVTVAGMRRPVYIGESDNVGRRLIQHSRNEDREFDTVCVVTSKDLNLTKAHVRFLENRLTAIAEASGRAELGNALQPPAGILPESDVADMEYFIDQVRLMMPVLGYDVLREPFVEEANPVQASASLTGAATMTGSGSIVPSALPLRLRRSQIGLQATATERDGEVVVHAGSLADANPDFAMNQYSGLRDRLIGEAVLVATEDSRFLRFASDTVFASPSAAAAVIYGRNANGRTSWLIDGTSQTLRDYQNERLPEL